VLVSLRETPTDLRLFQSGNLRTGRARHSIGGPLPARSAASFKINGQ
jgi:hypothetical protein